MRTKFKIYIMLLAVACSACSDWLDIQPSDRISEKNNFSDVAGFKKALNGVYVELNRPSLYGKNLTCGFVEILAQRYAVGEDNKATKECMMFNYTGSVGKSTLSSIWSLGYTLIANVNSILKNCEEHRDVLPEEYYHLIKGEALALRAYLHFDLFRLFGPVYKESPELMSIPYYTEFSLNAAPTYPANEFMKKVIQDLTDAEKELENDPVIEYGVAGNKSDVFLQYRNLRLNYYAVQALMARVFYYAGDERAFDYAKKVIAVQETHFPWVTPLKLTGAVADRMFSSEVLFALQNLERNSIFSSTFDGSNLKLNTLLSPKKDVVDAVFDNNQADYRYSSSLNNTVEITGNTYCIFNKYQSQSTDSLYMQMIPMLRVSEAYLIATELAPSEDKLTYFNEFLNHRGLRSLSRYSSYYYEQEWKKEFYGEGQLFFWYKRNNMTEMQSANDPWGTVKVKILDYVMPIPDEESKYN